jgi:hypothetical protein
MWDESDFRHWWLYPRNTARCVFSQMCAAGAPSRLVLGEQLAAFHVRTRRRTGKMPQR